MLHSVVKSGQGEENKMGTSRASGKNQKTGPSPRKQPGPGRLFVLLGLRLSSPTWKYWESLRGGGSAQASAGASYHILVQWRDIYCPGWEIPSTPLGRTSW